MFYQYYYTIFMFEAHSSKVLPCVVQNPYLTIIKKQAYLLFLQTLMNMHLF